MTKANKQTQMELVSVQEDPRIRMKEIRSLVAKAVKKQERLDLMSFNEKDRTRVIIALQDALEKSNNRHKKASTIVADQKFYMELSAAGMDCMVQGFFQNNQKNKIQIQYLSEVVKKQNASLNEMDNEIAALRKQNQALKETVRTFAAE